VAIDPSFAGRTYPPTEPYEVGVEKIREFAAALGDDNPAYRDRSAAAALGHPDVIAPPTFPFVLTFQASRRLIDDPDLGIDYSRVVHGEQKFVHHRPIRAGDRLVATTTIDAVRSVAGNDLLTTRVDLATEDGEPVCTATSMLVARGTA
jgi:acyl dehydratase